MRDVLNHRPSVFDPVLAIPIGLVLISFVAIMDATVFDGYVLPQLSKCYGTNLSDECIQTWKNLGCEVGNQMCIGNNYWRILEGVVILFGGVMFVIRIGFGKLGGSKWNGMLFLVAFLWLVTMTTLFYFGWVDTLYYAIRGMPIPEILPWLNGIGLFPFMQWFGSTSDVDASELYLLNTLGVLAIVGGWAKVIYIHKKVTRKRKR